MLGRHRWCWWVDSTRAANAGVVLIPMALVGLGIGALASQLGAITVSAVPDAQSAEVGGLQNTFTNFGASLGTALVGAVLIGSLTTGFIARRHQQPGRTGRGDGQGDGADGAAASRSSPTPTSRTALSQTDLPPAPPRTPSWRRTPRPD